MSTASISAITNDNERDDQYYTYLNKAFNNPINTINVKLSNGKVISLLIAMNQEVLTKYEKKFKCTKLLFSEWNCMTCVNRFNKLRMYIDADGNPIFCNFNDDSQSEIQKNLNTKCKELIDKYKSDYLYQWAWNLVIVDNDTLFTQGLFEGCDEKTQKEFIHYSYTPDKISDKLNDFEKKFLPKALQKYNHLFNNLFLKIGDISKMILCCSELTKLLEKAVYGKTQIHAINWFISILKKIEKHSNFWSQIDFNIKLKIIAEAICKSSICEGDSESAHIGNYHTINGYILDILENGHDPHSVIKMIEERNDPSKYRRKTAAPKEGNIKAGEKLCENLVNTIETIEQLEKHEGCVKIGLAKENTMKDAFSIMRNKNDKYSSFADRMSLNTSVLKTIKTISDLIKYINLGYIKKIQIYTKNMSMCYTATTSLEKSDLSLNIDHLWSYSGNTSRFKTFEEITHIYNIKVGRFNNIIFIVSNSRQTLDKFPIKGNCLFPEFLAAKHRTCESVVEKLNTLTNVQIPKEKELSLGVGTSVTFENGKLMSNVSLKITCKENNVHEIYINSM